MIIDFSKINFALVNIITHRDSIIFLDANVLISPDRTKLGAQKALDFNLYKETVLNPLFDNWSGLCVHEAVYDEFVAESVKAFADEMKDKTEARLVIHSNSELSENERGLYNSNIDKLAKYSNYNPDIDNTDDRGEIQSLAFMAVKGYIYFSSNDGLPIRLITRAEEYNSGLGDMGIIQLYEIIYVLHKFQLSDDENLRLIYKYVYYATSKDKKKNLGWSEFLNRMDKLYGDIC